MLYIIIFLSILVVFFLVIIIRTMLNVPEFQQKVVPFLKFPGPTDEQLKR